MDRVNYYLDYGTSETVDLYRQEHRQVSYCLTYGASETNGTPRAYL